MPAGCTLRLNLEWPDNCGSLLTHSTVCTQLFTQHCAYLHILEKLTARNLEQFSKIITAQVDMYSLERPLNYFSFFIFPKVDFIYDNTIILWHLFFSSFDFLCSEKCTITAHGTFPVQPLFISNKQTNNSQNVFLNQLQVENIYIYSIHMKISLKKFKTTESEKQVEHTDPAHNKLLLVLMIMLIYCIWQRFKEQYAHSV